MGDSEPSVSTGKSHIPEDLIPKEIEKYVHIEGRTIYVPDNQDNGEIGREVSDLIVRLRHNSDVPDPEKKTMSWDEFEEKFVEEKQQDGIGTNVDDSAPIREMVNMIRNAVVRHDSTDLHIDIRPNKAIVEHRVNDELTARHNEDPIKLRNMVKAMYNSEMVVDKHKNFNPSIPMEGAIQNENYLPQGVESGRIQITPTAFDFKCVIRLHHSFDASDMNLESLGFLPLQRQLIEEMGRKMGGTRLVTGPTGSGKNTTMLTALEDYLDEVDNTKHLVTIEDPIEIELNDPGVTQIPAGQLGSDNPFARGVEVSMRLDPNIVMIGEIRSHAAASAALEAGDTGHQVWATLHTESAAESINRLRKLDVPAYELTNSGIITGLINQRLVRQLCPNCKKPYEPKNQYEVNQQKPLINWIENEFNTTVFERVYESDCNQCDAGTVGRELIAEVIRPDDTLLKMLYEKKRAEARDYWRKELQGFPISRHGLRKIASGVCDPRALEETIGGLLEYETRWIRQNFQSLGRALEPGSTPKEGFS